MHEGKITRQDKECRSVLQKRSPRLAESQRPPGSIPSPARPASPASKPTSPPAQNQAPFGADGRRVTQPNNRERRARGRGLAPHCRLARLSSSGVDPHALKETIHAATALALE